MLKQTCVRFALSRNCARRSPRRPLHLRFLAGAIRSHGKENRLNSSERSPRGGVHGSRSLSVLLERQSEAPSRGRSERINGWEEYFEAGVVTIVKDPGQPPSGVESVGVRLAETALLAMEGRFEDYTLGRNISVERVKEIYHLFKKHQFQIAGLRSFDEFITDEVLQEKRAWAEKYRQDPELFARVRGEAEAKIAKMPLKWRKTP